MVMAENTENYIEENHHSELTTKSIFIYFLPWFSLFILHQKDFINVYSEVYRKNWMVECCGNASGRFASAGWIDIHDCVPFTILSFWKYEFAKLPIGNHGTTRSSLFHYNKTLYVPYSKGDRMKYGIILVFMSYVMGYFVILLLRNKERPLLDSPKEKGK